MKRKISMMLMVIVASLSAIICRNTYHTKRTS